jgi:sporulation protein YlmC with PRC-barrel domain
MPFKNLLCATTLVALGLGAGAALGASETATTATTDAGAAGITSGTSAGTAGAQVGGEEVAEACMEDLNQAERDLGEDARSVPGRQLRTLYEAATIFARAGMDEACESVVDGIREYGEERAEREARSEEEQAAYAERMRNARPLSEANSRYRAGSLIGDTVVGRGGDTIGEVDDVMISADGKARYVLVGTGGFLGMGKDYVPIEMDRLSVVDEDTLALPVEAEILDEAPRVERDGIDEEMQSWAREVETWWGEHVGPQKASNQ